MCGAPPAPLDGKPLAPPAETALAGDPARVSEFVAQPVAQPLEDVEVLWLDPSEETGLVAAVFATATGTVRID